MAVSSIQLAENHRSMMNLQMPKARRRKTGLDEALEDIKAGRVYHAKDVDDLFAQCH